jgi:enoyl-CoA hydratase
MSEAVDFQHVRVAIRDGVAVVTIERPPVNALNAAVLAELDAAFERLRSDDAVRAVVVAGAGEKAFVAGADIAELAKLTPAEARAASASGQRVFDHVEECGKVVVAAINGVALGGGLELALACHVRFACPEARLGLPEVTLGLIPGYGGTQRLPLLVGPGRAVEMIASGDAVDAATAERIGLVNRVVPRAELLGAAEAFAQRVASRGPLAVRYALRAVLGGSAATMNGFEAERESFEKCFKTADMREGTRAFLEKRKPEFKGV